MMTNVMIKSLATFASLALATTALSGGALAQDWTGPYVGVQAGYGDLSADAKDSNYAPGFANDPNLTGGLFGIEAGINGQLPNNLVLGIAADVSFSTLSGDGSYYSGGSLPYELDMNYLATLQAKVGMPLGASGMTMAYLTGGLAIAEVDLTGSVTNGTETHTGFIFGAGLEHMLNDSVSIGAEAAYLSLGRETYSGSESVSLDGFVGTVGLNFHF